MAFFSSHIAKTWFFTIYMGKRVGSPFGRMVKTIQDRQFRLEIAFTIFTITSRFQLSKNGRENLKLVSNMALKKRNTNSVPFEAFLRQIYQMKQRKKKNRVPFTDSNRTYRTFFVKFEQPTSLTVAVETDMKRRKMSSRCIDSGDFLRCKEFNCFASSLSS